jgi:hypothetical protein
MEVGLCRQRPDHRNTANGLSERSEPHLSGMRQPNRPVGSNMSPKEIDLMPAVPDCRPPTWYWLVSILGLIWMAFGVFALIMDLTTDKTSMEGLSQAQRALYEARPGWVFLLYAVAIFSGLLGTLGLLLRRSWAPWAFALSLAAIVLQFSYLLVVMEAVRLLGPAQALPFPLLIFAIGGFLLWFSRRAQLAGWLRTSPG